MSSSDRLPRASRLTALAVLCLAALAPLAGCTVRPLYARTAPAGPGGPGAEFADIRGRIDVAPANDRTGQIVRNALLFGFNGGETPAAPLYKVSFTAIGAETVVSIQTGSGIPSASIYRLTVNYTVARTTDAKVIAQGTRFSEAPFDRSRQIFAASRAFRDAQENAGRAAAEQSRLSILAAIRKDLPALLASVPAGKS